LIKESDINNSKIIEANNICNSFISKNKDLKAKLNLVVIKYNKTTS